MYRDGKVNRKVFLLPGVVLLLFAGIFFQRLFPCWTLPGPNDTARYSCLEPESEMICEDSGYSGHDTRSGGEAAVLDIQGIALLEAGERIALPAYDPETGAAATSARILLPAPDEDTGPPASSAAAYTAVIERVDTNVDGIRTIRARLDTWKSGFVIVTGCDDRISGVVDIPEKKKQYRIRTAPEDGSIYLAKVDVTELDVLEPSAPLEASGTGHWNPGVHHPGVHHSDRRLAPASDEHAIIDIMVVYTGAAKDWAEENAEGMALLIAEAMEKTQLAMDNSDTGITVRLVNSALVDYAEADDGNESVQDLNRLTGKSNGYLDEVHDMRDEYGADLVVFLTLAHDTGGVAWLLTSKEGNPATAFSLVRVQQAVTTYTFAHETGHNMGLHHHAGQNVQPGPTSWSDWPENTWSAGWRWTGQDEGHYSSIMTYRRGEYFDDGIDHVEVPYFSNPDILFQGTATGHLELADNARTLREIKHVIAAYRHRDEDVQNGQPSFTLIAEPAELTVAQGSSGTVEIRIADAVNFDSDVELNVQHPENLSIEWSPAPGISPDSMSMLTINVPEFAETGLTSIRIEAASIPDSDVSGEIAFVATAEISIPLYIVRPEIPVTVSGHRYYYFEDSQELRIEAYSSDFRLQESDTIELKVFGETILYRMTTEEIETGQAELDFFALDIKPGPGMVSVFLNSGKKLTARRFASITGAEAVVNAQGQAFNASVGGGDKGFEIKADQSYLIFAAEEKKAIFPGRYNLEPLQYEVGDNFIAVRQVIEPDVFLEKTLARRPVYRFDQRAGGFVSSNVIDFLLAPGRGYVTTFTMPASISENDFQDMKYWPEHPDSVLLDESSDPAAAISGHEVKPEHSDDIQMPGISGQMISNFPRILILPEDIETDWKVEKLISGSHYYSRTVHTIEEFEHELRSNLYNIFVMQAYVASPELEEKIIGEPVLILFDDDFGIGSLRDNAVIRAETDNFTLGHIEKALDLIQNNIEAMDLSENRYIIAELTWSFVNIDLHGYPESQRIVVLPEDCINRVEAMPLHEHAGGTKVKNSSRFLCMHLTPSYRGMHALEIWAENHYARGTVDKQIYIDADLEHLIIQAMQAFLTDMHISERLEHYLHNDAITEFQLKTRIRDILEYSASVKDIQNRLLLNKIMGIYQTRLYRLIEQGEEENI